MGDDGVCSFQMSATMEQPESPAMVTRKLTFIAAPMVNQSDLPFRCLVQCHGATLAYTQMLVPDKLLNEQDYLEHHLRDLYINSGMSDRPVIVQLCGDNVEAIVQAGRKLERYCQGIDLNLGCPLDAARDGHYGAYLLGQRDWPLVREIVSGMSRSFTVPVSAKLRLCQSSPKTLDFARTLEASGASWITLHARTVSARRRRRGAADLSEVKRLKENMSIPIISNGNVRGWSDIQENLAYTNADGVMVGETLLGNPCLFENITPDPVCISLEYLHLCEEYPSTVSIPIIQTHVRHFIDFQCGRRPWFPKFRAALGATRTTGDIERLLRLKVEKWRGRPAGRTDHDAHEEEEVDLDEAEADADNFNPILFG